MRAGSVSRESAAECPVQEAVEIEMVSMPSENIYLTHLSNHPDRGKTSTLLCGLEIS